MNKNKIITFFLSFFVLFGQTSVYAQNATGSNLFHTSEKAFKKVHIKTYTWNRDNFTMQENYETPTTTLMTSAQATEKILSELTAGKEKVSMEFEYENNYKADSAINVKSLEDFSATSGKNEYSKGIQDSSYKDSKFGAITGKTNLNVVDDISNRTKIFTLVTNYGEKGRTYGVKTWESKTAKKIYVEGFRVNYIDMYAEEIQRKCFIGEKIPQMLVSPSSVLALAGHVSGKGNMSTEELSKLSKYPGLIDLKKTPTALSAGDNGICSLPKEKIAKIVYETGIFYPSGDLRLSNKNPNENLTLAASATSDAIYFKNGTDASLVYDKDWHLQKHKKSKRWFREQHWLTVTTSTAWLKIIPLSFVSEQNNFGSYAIADANKNGTKIAGLFPQTSILSSTSLTPDGHSLNFVVIPVKKYDNTGIGGEPLVSSGTYQESPRKTTWAQWFMTLILIVVIIIIIIIVGPHIGIELLKSSLPLIISNPATASAAAFILAMFIQPILDMHQTFSFSTINGQPTAQRNADVNSMVDKTSYKKIAQQFTNIIDGKLLKENNTDMFWESMADTGNVMKALDKNGNYGNNVGTEVWNRMKDTKFFGSGHIIETLKFFNQSVELNAPTSGGGIKHVPNGNLAPRVNYKYLVDQITSVIDYSFTNKTSSTSVGTRTEKQNWKTIDKGIAPGQQVIEHETRIESTNKTDLEILDEVKIRNRM